MSAATAPRASRLAALLDRHALAAVIAAGALLRFATLSVQSFWLDEQVTLDLVQLPFLDLLERIPLSESNPDLYYLGQAVWERAFGTSEFGIRSFSALAGTLTIPFAYAAARVLASRSAGLIAAALAAFGPMLIWYSQEARNYSLFVLLAAIAFWCFARALADRGHRWILAWVLASALALCTHYFAVFLIVPQLAWLAWKRPQMRIELAAGAGVIGAVGVALLPTFASELGRGSWISDYSFGDRLLQIPEHFLAGMLVPWPFVPAALIAVAGIGVLAAISTARGEALRAAIPAAATFAAGIALLLLAAAAGEDYILSRNLIGLWAPFGVAVAVVLAAGRPWIATATTAALCVGGAALAIWLPATPEAHRPDYRGLAEALADADEDRLIVSQTSFSSPLPLYLEDTRIAAEAELATQELVVITPRPITDYSVGTCWWIATCGGVDQMPPPPFEVPAGFELERTRSTTFFDIDVYEADARTAIDRPVELFTPRVFRQDAAG